MSYKNEIEQLPCDSVKCIQDDEGYLGGGTFGVVRAGFHDKYGSIAAKCIRYLGSYTKKQKFIKKIWSEVCHLQNANHENVVRLYGLAQWSNCIGIIMEYLPNGNLRELLYDEDVVLGAFLRLRFCVEIAAGLAFIHNFSKDKRLVHGDLKAENILLTDDLHCKIGDFGSSTLLNYTEHTTVMNSNRRSNEFTPIYAAPELLKDQGMKLKPSNDTYSFAIILYMILKRKCPVTQISVLEKYLNDVKQEKRPNLDNLEELNELKNCKKSQEVIQQIVKVAKACWAQAPAQRPSMQSVRNFLQTCFASIPASNIHSQVAEATSNLDVTKFSTESHYKCVTIDELRFEAASEQSTDVVESSMHSSGSGSDTSSTNGENSTTLSQSSNKLTEEKLHNKLATNLLAFQNIQEVAAQSKPSKNSTDDVATTSANRSLPKAIPKPKPGRNLHRDDSHLEQTIISATLKAPSSVENEPERSALPWSSSLPTGTSTEPNIEHNPGREALPYIHPHDKRRSYAERSSKSESSDVVMRRSASVSAVSRTRTSIYERTFEPSYNGFVTIYQHKVLKFNATTFKHEVLPNLKYCHSEGSSVELEGKIYVIGGWKTKKVEVLDLAKRERQWREVCSTSEDCELSASAVCKGTIYTVGGGTWRNPKSSGEKYVPFRDQWLNINNMNQKRQGHALVELNDQLYAIGGKGLNSAEVYDPDKKKWTPIPPMTSARFKFAAVAFKQKIYAIGGEDGRKWSEKLKSVECFDPRCNRWEKVANLRAARSGHCACVIRGKIFVVGGIRDEIECFDPISNTWKFETSNIHCQTIDTMIGTEEK